MMAPAGRVGVAFALTAWATIAVAQQEDTRLRTGAHEFLNSCSSCHGGDGRGAGFLTRVFGGIDPGDLTKLAQNNGGTFPWERVFDVIDGRVEVAAHGDRTMPVWGDRYMASAEMVWGQDELNEERVQNRIYALILYLLSIQERTAE